MKPQTIDRDFGLNASLDANTVRVFVQPLAFGVRLSAPVALASG